MYKNCKLVSPERRREKKMALVEIENTKDMDMAAAAEQLMQLSGDEDNDNRISSSDTGNINSVLASDSGNIKRKNRKDVVEAWSHDNADDERSSSNHQLSEGLMRLAKRRRRYRSVIHIYMSTKPVRSIG